FEGLASRLDKLIEERNSRLIHSTTKRTPDSFYENFVPQVPSQAMLDYLLMDVRRCKVKDSSIMIEGHLYRGEELWKLAGEEVEVRRDPRNIVRAVIVHKGEIFGTVSEEMPDHYRGPITLESRKTNARIRRKIQKFRKEVWAAEGIINDPLRMEIEIEKETTLRERDIRPAPSSNVILLDRREKLARGSKKALNQVNNEELEEAQAAVGGGRKDIYSRLAASLKPNSENDAPLLRYISKLSYKEIDDDTF
ncbi:MAG: Mu transposase C-terminal domain-containing protein, partial [Syntrophales bacterium LBB04]|nr:Mu transposase C-terminal domain-containing protein [Syntrophales bacterium LBB04]